MKKVLTLPNGSTINFDKVPPRERFKSVGKSRIVEILANVAEAQGFKVYKPKLVPREIEE